MVIDSVTISQRLEQFNTRHGGDAVQIEGWWVYSNGAMRETNPLGALHDPPDDPHHRAKIVLRYHEERLRRAVYEFEEAKSHNISIAKGNIRNSRTPAPPDASAVASLKALLATVRERQRQVEAARQAVSASRPDWMIQREVDASENRARNEAFLAEISELKI